MALKDLIGGSLWDEYSKKVSDRMNNPLFLGELSEEEASEMGCKLIVADYGAESCGDSVRLYWIVDTETDKILKAKFKSFGCGTAIASSDMMCELCLGKTVEEAVAITNINVEHALRDHEDTPAVPPQKMHCSVMAYDVIKKAVSLYRGVDMESLEKEVIVCECARVTLSDVEDCIRINDLKSVEQITEYTKAGAFCKSCIHPGGHEKKEHYLVDILKRVRAEMEQAVIEEQDFEAMSIVKQIKAIEVVFDASIRPALAQDGGGLELQDVEKDDDNFIVSIQYSGACSSCAGAMHGTLQFIEGKLKKELSENIKVKVV